MRLHTTTCLLTTAVILSGGLVSLAQDAPPPPPPPQEKPAAATASDPEALALLERAAKRQGGDALAADGALRSFRIEFGRVKVRRSVQQKDGSTVTATEEATALEIDWMRHDDGTPSSLRTFWEINGKKVTRAVLGTRNWFWIFDGTLPATQLAEGMHDADREEVLLHRRLSETLIDVAVLRKLLTDGSVWSRVEDRTYEGVALRRTPAPGAGGLRFTIWLDPETSDPHHVRVEPVENDAPHLHYELRHVEGRPTVDGAELRFPFEVIVREATSATEKPDEETMHLWIKRVVFNQCKLDDFVPPTPR